MEKLSVIDFPLSDNKLGKNRKYFSKWIIKIIENIT